MEHVLTAVLGAVFAAIVFGLCFGAPNVRTAIDISDCIAQQTTTTGYDACIGQYDPGVWSRIVERRVTK